MTDERLTDGGTDSGQSDFSHQLTYEIDANELPSEATVRAVAVLRDSSLLALDPLYHAIDPNYLDGAFERGGVRSAEPELSFTYAGCAVTVTDSEVTVRSNEE